MKRAGRNVDPVFSPNEKLYLRCRAEWIDGNRRLKVANVHFPDQSVNREKFSKNYDVLLPDATDKSKTWIFWGVVEVAVGNLPPSAKNTNGIEFEFKVEHDPLEDNYSHAEIRVFKNGTRDKEKGKISDSVKKAYRTKIAENTQLVVNPLI